MFKAPFTDFWQMRKMHDDGRNGDKEAGDGKYSIVINILRSDRVEPFAFDDSNSLRSQHESVLAEIIKAMPIIRHISNLSD